MVFKLQSDNIVTEKREVNAFNQHEKHSKPAWYLYSFLSETSMAGFIITIFESTIVDGSSNIPL